VFHATVVTPLVQLKFADGALLIKPKTSVRGSGVESGAQSEALEHVQAGRVKAAVEGKTPPKAAPRMRRPPLIALSRAILS
jgi:hypothetical protein